MKLTKELEAELVKTIRDHRDACMAGDLATWASFLAMDSARHISQNRSLIATTVPSLQF